jgi:hypothetical protein
MFRSTKYKPKKIKTIEITKKTLNLGILNKFRIGVRITRIKPAKLLIKNLGYLRMFVQKLFINEILFVINLLFYINV